MSTRATKQHQRPVVVGGVIGVARDRAGAFAVTVEFHDADAYAKLRDTLRANIAEAEGLRPVHQVVTLFPCYPPKDADGVTLNVPAGWVGNLIRKAYRVRRTDGGGYEVAGRSGTTVTPEQLARLLGLAGDVVTMRGQLAGFVGLVMLVLGFVVGVVVGRAL